MSILILYASTLATFLQHATTRIRLAKDPPYTPYELPLANSRGRPLLFPELHGLVPRITSNFNRKGTK